MSQFKYIIFFIFFHYLFNLEAQVIILGNGAFTGSNFAGPANTSTSVNAASRYAYIFPQNTVNSLVHNDTISSLSFMRNGGAGSISGLSNMRIFIRTTVNTSYGSGSVNWVNLTSSTGMKKVYDQNPSSEIGNSDGWVRFVFTSPYVVDTVFGKNLEILVEYTQSSAQQANIFWNYENSGTVFGYAANQTKFIRTNGGTLTDTTNASSDVHPTIRIEFPRHDFDLFVKKIYSLGKIPVPLGNPDSVKAIIQNVGKKDATFKVFIESKGANNLIDSTSYTIPYLGEKLFVLPVLSPSNIGLDTITVKIEKDSNISNNTLSVYRLSTKYIYSYKDPTLPIAGGIGFNGSTGDFVAKFYSNKAKAINQISVRFAGSNQKFKLGIWETDSLTGIPSKNIWTSDTLQTATSFITPVLPAIPVNGSFFVGVRQIGLANVAFGYQPESPVRSKTFYYAAPLGDTNWVDFSPGAPFKFAIEPRLQALNDIAPTKVIVPIDTIYLTSINTMAPKATIVNYGTANQLSPFNVKVNIFRYGYLEYTSIRQDTLSAGLMRDITFDSSFLPSNAGDYDIQVITMLSGDQMIDNDTLRSKFIVAAFKDVGPGTIFDPSSGYDYEQFVDTIYPTVFVQNYGLDAQGPFNVRAEIYDSTNNLIYSDSRAFTLTPLNSVLASFKTFPCDVKGRYYFRAFTELNIDVDKTNDTVSRYFKIIRSNDVTISKITYPENNKVLLPPVAIKRPEAVLINVGEANQSDPFEVFCEVYFKDSLIYRDSININSFKTIPQTLLFKNFQPILKGYYKMLVYASLPSDQFRGNDTLTSNFSVGIPDDVEVLSISPQINSGLELDSNYITNVTLRNNGYNPQTTPFTLVFKVSRGGATKYLKVKQVTIDSGETKVYTLDTSLRLDGPGTFDVLVYTILSKDFIKTNDTLKGNYFGVKSFDVGVSKIVYPTVIDSLLLNTQNVEPVIEIRNLGDSMLSERFTTTLKIFNKSNKVLLYNKNIDTSLNGQDSILVKFPGFGISGSLLNILVQAYTNLDRDQFHLNDTAFSESQFVLWYDVSAEGILLPVSDTTYYKNTSSFLPRISVKNQSIKTLNDVLCIFNINEVDTVTFLENEVYRDSILVQNILTSENRLINMFDYFSLTNLNKGVYKAYLQVLAENDQVPSNNSLFISFRIDENTGLYETITDRLKIYPLPVSTILTLAFNNNESLPEKVVFYDMYGKIVIQLHPNDYITSVDVSNLASGIYTIQSGEQLIKIIVEH